uniref:Uncharacterized protein n=1 Tax=Oryza glumipatula TaxID=40148 RepID=A0A0D9ZDH2_9ORYZ
MPVLTQRYKYHLQVLQVLIFQYMHHLETFCNFCSSLVTFLLIEHLKKPHELLYRTHISRSTILKTGGNKVPSTQLVI